MTTKKIILAWLNENKGNVIGYQHMPAIQQYGIKIYKTTHNVDTYSRIFRQVKEDNETLYSVHLALQPFPSRRHDAEHLPGAQTTIRYSPVATYWKVLHH